MAFIKKSKKYIVLSVLACILSYAVIMVGINVFYTRTVEKKYSEISETVSQIVSAAIDENSIDSWIKGGNVHNYTQASNKLKSIKSSFEEIDSILICQMREDGKYTVFNSATDNPRFDLGNVESYNSKWVEHKKEFLSGKAVNDFIANGYSGQIKMSCDPIFDSNHKYVAHICVGVSLDKMADEVNSFILIIGAAIFAGIAGLYFIILVYIKLKAEKRTKVNFKNAKIRVYALFIAAFIMMSVASVGLNAYEQRNEVILDNLSIAESTEDLIKSIIPQNRVSTFFSDTENDNYKDFKKYISDVVKESSSTGRIFISEMQKDKMHLILDTDNIENTQNKTLDYPENLKVYINDFIDGKDIDTFVTKNSSDKKIALALTPVSYEDGNSVCYLGIEKVMTGTNEIIKDYVIYTSVIIMISLTVLLLAELVITINYLKKYKEA